MLNLSSVEAKRFWKKVNVKGVNDCWEWNAAKTSSGYGNFVLRGRNYVAHRLMYVLIRGDVEPEKDLDHLCSNRACVNPRHLESVTRSENLLRGDTIPAKNAAKTHCPEGHAYDAENTYICSNGSRHCRECRRVRTNDYYHNVIKKRRDTDD